MTSRGELSRSVSFRSPPMLTHHGRMVEQNVMGIGSKRRSRWTATLELIFSLVSHKNRWFHRGGYSPCQLVFGCNPRIPLELLSDDGRQAVALDDVLAHGFEQDSAASEFTRSQLIRDRARELCIKNTAKDRVRLSTQKQTHQQRTWFPGQWVYVWRRFSGTGQGHATRSRWTGPGLVLLQSGTQFGCHSGRDFSNVTRTS